MLNILETIGAFIVSFLIIGMVIYALARYIKAFIELIKDMIDQRRFVENKFYFVMGFVSLILPFVLLFRYGINPETKCLCVMAFPSSVFFTIKSWGYKTNFFDVFKGKVRDEDKIGLSSEVLEKIEAMEEKCMKVYSKYSKQKNKFIILFIIFLIFTIITIYFTLYIDILAMIYTHNVGAVLIVTIGELIILRGFKPFLTLCGSAKFDITFYKDRFEYKGILKQKVVKYDEIESIRELWIVTGRFDSPDAKILEIKSKSKKKKDRICILDGILKEEDRDNLLMDCRKFFGKEIKYKSKFILFV
jgi:hypothetical protein